MPALPCGRTSPVGAGRPTAHSIPSPLPPINGINGGQNSISHAGSGSCPKPDLRPHRPSFITDAAPDKTGAALFVFSRRAPAVSLREITPRKTLSRTAKTRIPLPRKHKNRRGAPLGGGMAGNTRHTFFFASSAEALFICVSRPHPIAAHRFRRRAFNGVATGVFAFPDSLMQMPSRYNHSRRVTTGAPSPDSLTLRGRVLTPPLSRRDTGQGA